MFILRQVCEGFDGLYEADEIGLHPALPGDPPGSAYLRLHRGGKEQCISGGVVYVMNQDGKTICTHDLDTWGNPRKAEPPLSS